MKLVKIGVMSKDKVRQRLLDIASGRISPSNDEPKIWCHSIESLSGILKKKNADLTRFHTSNVLTVKTSL
ncbi:MAG: hypothetical protein GJ680_21150 [Alteromonadaceae bacterium]|nr:hypothetical protein [Alteromonadaceae bacterium]